MIKFMVHFAAGGHIDVPDPVLRPEAMLVSVVHVAAEGRVAVCDLCPCPC